MGREAEERGVLRETEFGVSKVGVGSSRDAVESRSVGRGSCSSVERAE